MKREIREVDGLRGCVQVTFPDERWYSRRVCVGTTDEQWEFVPSVTWVTGHYPKGVAYFKWLASKSWDEAEDIKACAGEKGDKVHQAIGVLLAGGTVKMEDCFRSNRTGELETLTPQEYECLMSFAEWFAEEKPEVLAVEYTVWNERYGYAGTIDLKCRLKSTGYRCVHIIDFKTSPDIWPSMKLQVSAYKHADPTLPKSTRLGILQVGYKRNKHKKWKYTPVSDCFDLFLAVRKIWKAETEGQRPLQREFPLEITLRTQG